MKYRFVGGPMHGQLRALQHSSRYDASIYEGPNYLCAQAMSSPAAAGPSYTTVRYERRPVELDGFARVYVMAVVGMGQAEFMRRLADIIEDV